MIRINVSYSCLRHIRSGLPVTTFHVADQPFKCYIVNTFTTLTTYNVPSLLCRPFHEGSASHGLLPDSSSYGVSRSKSYSFDKALQESHKCSWTGSLARLPAHNLDCSLCQMTRRLIRDHQILIKFHFVTKAETLRAGTKRIIKRKASRLNLINADSTVRAGKALAENCIGSPSMTSTVISPSASSRTFSMESVRRFSMPSALPPDDPPRFQCYAFCFYPG